MKIKHDSSRGTERFTKSVALANRAYVARQHVFPFQQKEQALRETQQQTTKNTKPTQRPTRTMTSAMPRTLLLIAMATTNAWAFSVTSPKMVRSSFVSLSAVAGARQATVAAQEISVAKPKVAPPKAQEPASATKEIPATEAKPWDPSQWDPSMATYRTEDRCKTTATRPDLLLSI